MFTWPSAKATKAAKGGENHQGRQARTDGCGETALNMPWDLLAPLPLELVKESIKEFRSPGRTAHRRGFGAGADLYPHVHHAVDRQYFIDRSRRATAFAEQKKQEAEQNNVNRQIVEAACRPCGAQVEPHFLYNTLANVQALTGSIRIKPTR